MEEVEVGIGSTTEGSFVVALEGHGIGIMTNPMHISRGVAQIIEAVIPGVVIGGGTSPRGANRGGRAQGNAALLTTSSVDGHMEGVERRNDEESPIVNCSRPTLLGRKVETSNEGDVFVCGTKTSSLIDSGSSVTTICESFYDSLECQPPLRDIKDFDLSVVAADGCQVPYIGYIEADISVPFLSSISFTIPVLIVSDTEYNRKFLLL